MDSSASPFLSLIIVCWNSEKYLSRCLDCLSRQTFKNFEILIIDNGSDDKSAIIDLVGKYPHLELHVKYLERNIGFTAANNLGAKLAQGKWLVLLNTDAFPEPNWLAELIGASEKNSDIATFSSRQLVAANPNILDGAGDAYHVSGMAWRIGLGYPARSYGLQPSILFSPCAAAAMYRRDAFLDAGGFDDDFFSYFEDVDLGFRLQLKGYRSMYVSEAVVYHIGSATFGVRSDFAFYHSHRNMVWTYFKNMPSLLLLRYLPEHLMANLIYLIYYTLKGRGKVLWKAKWDAIMGLPNALKKRRVIQSTRRVSNQVLLHSMQRGLLQPYVLGYQLRRALKKSPVD